MDLPNLLSEVQPGLTLYSLLVTFAVFSFAVARHFWQLQRTLLTENIDRLAELVQGFRRREIEPLIVRPIVSAADQAYEIAIAGLIGDLHGQKEEIVAGRIEPRPLDQAQRDELLTQSALRERQGQL
jgi:hypothetical protein